MAVTGPRCCGWHISVRSSGEAICANEFPNPRTKRPLTYTLAQVSQSLCAFQSE